ncbi:MAG: hypothetical protein ACRCV9_16420 [Burkholderiaceae bacterium]
MFHQQRMLATSQPAKANCRLIVRQNFRTPPPLVGFFRAEIKLYSSCLNINRRSLYTDAPLENKLPFVNAKTIV